MDMDMDMDLGLLQCQNVVRLFGRKFFSFNFWHNFVLVGN